MYCMIATIQSYLVDKVLTIAIKNSDYKEWQQVTLMYKFNLLTVITLMWQCKWQLFIIRFGIISSFHLNGISFPWFSELNVSTL